MRRITMLVAGFILVLGGLAAAPPAGAEGPNEYICSMYVTPSSQSVTVGQNAYFSVQRNVCSRSTGQFLYTDPNGTYWSSGNGSLASVGSATNNATMNVTVTTYGVGTVTITAIALCCDINYQGVHVSATLTINPAPLSTYIIGSWDVQYGGSCSWYAQVSGGTAPYSYAWYREGYLVSTSSSYGESGIYYGFNLQLDVTDSAGRAASDSRYISVYYNYSNSADSKDPILRPDVPFC